MAPQVLFELFAVVTNPRRVTAVLSPDEAVAMLNSLLECPGVTLLPPLPNVVVLCLKHVQDGRVSGRKIFDAQLAATMLGHGVNRICTFNRADFAGFEGVEVFVPTVSGAV